MSLIQVLYIVRLRSYFRSTLYFHCNFCFCGARCIFGFHSVYTTMVPSSISNKEAGGSKDIGYFHIHPLLNFFSIFEPSYSRYWSSLHQSFNSKAVSRLNSDTIKVLRAKLYNWCNYKRKR